MCENFADTRGLTRAPLTSDVELTGGVRARPLSSASETVAIISKAVITKAIAIDIARAFDLTATGGPYL